ncbi:M61 family metallopeptidase [Okeania hirsuta]|uniref:M61 family metallopeptidase n=1 Tax=Okeania hirsuta TaxID=1458930 RepID=UPI001374EDE6
MPRAHRCYSPNYKTCQALVLPKFSDLPTYSFTFYFPEHFSFAQAPIQYHLNLDDIGQHELKYTVEFPSVPLRCPYSAHARALPGRYAVHNFAKNVYDVKAWMQKAKELSIDKNTVRKNGKVSGHDGYVNLSIRSSELWGWNLYRYLTIENCI